jgi:hypothetical protein
MENKKYIIATLNHNEINLISSGNSANEVENSLVDSLRMWFISADMFNNFQAPNDPSYFLGLARDAYDKASIEDRVKVYDLSSMSDIFEGKKKISQLSSSKTSTDTLRHWSCLWQISKTTTGGLLGEVPTLEELRWLVIDTGFYITKLNPCPIPPKSNNEKEQLICELMAHFDVAFKFGAPQKILFLIADIVNDITTNINETQGDFSHLSLEELILKLNGRRSLERMNERSETKFWVAGPSSEELEVIISKRKENPNLNVSSSFNLKFSPELSHFISLIKNSK